MDSLLVFAREPRPGKAGLSLCPPLHPEEAALLCHAMLRDSLRAARELEGLRIRIIMNPGSSLGFVEGPYEWEAPFGLTLGRRMARAMQAAFKDSSKVLALSSQAPLLGSRRIQEAFSALDKSALCLIPGLDGGVIGLGLSRMLPVFEGVEWEGKRALRQAYERGQALGLRPGLLEEGLLVDGLFSLEALAEECRKDPLKAPLSAMVMQAFLTKR